MKKANNFQLAKVQPQGVRLIFCQIQPCVAYRSAAYRKCMHYRSSKTSNSPMIIMNSVKSVYYKKLAKN